MLLVSGIPMLTTAQTASGELVIALQQDMIDMSAWNPDTNDVWKNFQIGWCFEGLMAYNPDYELYPVLAAEKATGPNGVDATISADGLTITVKIKENVQFHDGHVMDSQDVVFSYQTLAWGLFQTQVLGPLYWDDGTTFARYDSTETAPTITKIGVEASGPNTVVFHLVDNYAMFWYLTMAVPIMPYHIWNTHTVDAVAKGYNVTNEKTWDYSYGSKVTELDAAIGTGPMKIQSWVKESGSVIVPFEDYWDKTGTTTWKGVEYPNYPQHVTSIRFKIYTQLDVAILALQNGDVHHLPWSLTPGYYNLLKNDPNVGIELNKDQGFFYMSFNMRKGAMADVNFRRAISYCVDKQYIVDRLMGGYGIQGSVPISVTNTFYVNSSVPAWIVGGNLDAAKALLDAKGYTDKDGDGWRDMPDGSPLKYNILTPPKDYDPIRADSGIMIEKNLKSIGLNIAAVPTSFNTIVSAAYVSLEFDMYILGWSVGSFPESYLRDFFHSGMDVAVNPSGSNAAGYHNATVDTMIDDMEVEMDTDARAKLIKDISGATMMDVAYNTLYYRTNIEAYRKDIWTGWIPAFGTIYNGFSLYNLAPPGTTDTGTDGGSGGGSATITEIEATINTPSRAGSGQTISGSIIATDVFESGTVKTATPSVGASVHITTSYGKVITATTDATGKASFELTVPYQKIDSVRIDANISKTGVWTNVNKTIGIEFANHIAQLSLSTDNGVIAPGTTTIVTATVTDENGNPIAGVNVDVDTALMFGTVDAATKTTDATGIASFTYTAPPATMLPNQHRFEQFKANITVMNTIIPEIQSASLIIGISNSVYDWHSLDITGVTAYVIDNLPTADFPGSTAITLKLTDQTEAAVGSFPVSLELSADGTVIDADAMMKNTDTNGVVTFTLTVDPAFKGAQTVLATFNTSKAYSIKDSVAIYIRNNPTDNLTTYHVNITDVSNKFLSNAAYPANTSIVKARVFNDTWKPVSGVDVYMGLSNEDLVDVDAEFKTSNAFGNVTFNITCVANGSADLAIAFGIEDSVGICQGYNLKVNKTAATEKLPVLSEKVFGPALGGEKGPWNLTQKPVLNAKVYKANGGTWVEGIENTHYTLNYTTGEINMVDPLVAGDVIHARYNYTVAVTDENVLGAPAVGGEKGPWNLTNKHIYDASVFKYNNATGTALLPPTDYTLDFMTGSLAMVNQLSHGDCINVTYNYTTPTDAGNETLAAAAGGEMWVALSHPFVINATVYMFNVTNGWTSLTNTVEYTLNTGNGSLAMTLPMTAADVLSVYYNYTTLADAGNETLAAAAGGEMWVALSHPAVINATVYMFNGTNGWTLLTPLNYTLHAANGTLNMTMPMTVGDVLSVYYNYTVITPVATENKIMWAYGGETGLIGNLNIALPIADAQIRRNADWLTPITDYTFDPVTGAVTLTANIVLVAGDVIFANYNQTLEIVNETVATALGGETGAIGNLTQKPIFNATIYKENAGVWVKGATPADYMLNMTTGALTLNFVLEAGDNIYAFYNYTNPLPDHRLNVTSVSSYYVDSNPFTNTTPSYSNIVVRLQDVNGNAIVGKTVNALILSRGNINIVKPANVTNATGYAFFNVTSGGSDLKSSAAIYFQVNGTTGITESVTIFNRGYTPGYAADIDFTGIAGHNSTLEISATVYDEAGKPAPGVRCQLFIPVTSEGRPGVIQDGDVWDFYEYGGDNYMGDYATYLGSWLGDNATVTDAFGQLNATIDTPSFLADVEIPLQFGVGGTGVTAGFNYSANNFWMEWPGPDYDTPPLTDDADVYYWLEATFTMTDQAILKRAPMATLTKATMSQPFLSAADNTSTISLTFQDLAGPLNTKLVNIGEGTAKPVILDKDVTSAAGVYTYEYTTESATFDAGIGFTSVLLDAGYAKFPFNFYIPYLADGTTAKTLVASIVPAQSAVRIGQNIVLNVTVVDEYERIVSGATVVSGTQTATTDAQGKAQLTVSTAAQTQTGLFRIALDISSGTLSTDEDVSVILLAAKRVIIVGPVLDKGNNPIEGALVSISLAATRQADSYTGLTNATGYASIEVPESYLGSSVTVTITKDGYKTITYTTMLNQDGTLAAAPPVMKSEGGLSTTMLLLIVIVIVVVLVVAVMALRKKGGKEDEAAKPEPKAEEPKEPEEPTEPAEPAEEVIPEDAPAEDALEPKPETTE